MLPTIEPSGAIETRIIAWPGRLER
jgi:hypothetical protein